MVVSIENCRWHWALLIAIACQTSASARQTVESLKLAPPVVAAPAQAGTLGLRNAKGEYTAEKLQRFFKKEIALYQIAIDGKTKPPICKCEPLDGPLQETETGSWPPKKLTKIKPLDGLTDEAGEAVKLRSSVLETLIKLAD